ISVQAPVRGHPCPRFPCTRGQPDVKQKRHAAEVQARLWSADSHVRAFLAPDQVRADKAVHAPVALRFEIISSRSARVFQYQSGPSPGQRCIELRRRDHNGLVPGLRGRIESAAPATPARWLRKSEQTDVDPAW